MKYFMVFTLFLSALISPLSYAKSKLSPNESLTPGQSLTNGSYRFILQTDGNLVLYKGSNPLWSSRTDGIAIREAIMQSDGNFVLYRHNNTPVWSSGTAGKNGGYLVLQSDGNVVIYYSPPAQAIWNTGTHRRN